MDSRAQSSTWKAVPRDPWCSESQAKLAGKPCTTGYLCTVSESALRCHAGKSSSACSKASCCLLFVPCNMLAAPTTHAARPWQAELGLGCRPYHRVVAITGQDDHINGRCVIGHADASISRSVFSKCETKVQMRREERSVRPARGTAWSSQREGTPGSRQCLLTGRGR